MGYFKVREVIMGDSLDANGNAIPGERYKLNFCYGGGSYSDYEFTWRTYTTVHVVYNASKAGKVKFRITIDPTLDKYYEKDVVAGDNEFFWTFQTYQIMPDVKWYYIGVASYVVGSDGQYHFETFCADKFITKSAPTTPPHIVLTNIDVAPNPALTTQTVDVVVYLKNDGGQDGTAHVVTRVYKNSSVVRETTKTFTVERYGSKVDYADHFSLPAGTYKVEVTVTETDSSKSVTLSVSDKPKPTFWVENNVKQAWLEYNGNKFYENQTVEAKADEKIYAKAEIVNMGVKGTIYFLVYDLRKKSYVAWASATIGGGYSWMASVTLKAEETEYEFHAAYKEGDKYVITDKAGCDLGSGSNFLKVEGRVLGGGV